MYTYSNYILPTTVGGWVGSPKLHLCPPLSLFSVMSYDVENDSWESLDGLVQPTKDR